MTLLFTLSDLGRLVVSLIDSLVEKLRRDEVHRLQMLPEVGVVLRDLETRVIQIRHIISPAENSFAIATDQQIKLELKGLLMQLKNTVYDGEDLVEEIEHDVLHHGVDQHQYEASSQSSSSFNSSATKRTSASSPVKLHGLIKAADSSVYKLREINLRLGRIATAIAEIIQVTNSVGADGGQKIQNADSVSSDATSFSVDGKVYGRDGEFNTLRKLLLKPSVGSGSGSLSAVEIFGVGGVRKTTLAQHSANIDFPDHINLDMLQVVVKKKIASKRFLLFIDDLWNAGWDMHKWDMLFAMLRPGVPSSKVLLTTRFRRPPTVASNWFTEEKLIRIWNAEGMIVPQANRRMRMEDVARKVNGHFDINGRLRTLIFSRMKEPWFETKISANHLFNRLKCIRVLILHDYGMIELPWTINHLIHLPYLDVSNNFGIQRLLEL
ncbi:hypothetical protein ZIOFF_050518 [Zingiber officinale]|uniref:NB-ARC domain-containing protein n=1 Tax=Zingiber officinale TaxID=94328 RepID=A0A8J5G0N9_ZINOF|nr:hypothetical protein ZIOFF_050518 [Zingiber officinale]